MCVCVFFYHLKILNVIIKASVSVHGLIVNDFLINLLSNGFDEIVSNFKSAITRTFLLIISVLSYRSSEVICF